MCPFYTITVEGAISAQREGSRTDFNSFGRTILPRLQIRIMKDEERNVVHEGTIIVEAAEDIHTCEECPLWKTRL